MPIMSDGESLLSDNLVDDEAFDGAEGFFIGPSSIDSRATIEYPQESPDPESHPQVDSPIDLFLLISNSPHLVSSTWHGAILVDRQ